MKKTQEDLRIREHEYRELDERFRRQAEELKNYAQEAAGSNLFSQEF